MFLWDFLIKVYCRDVFVNQESYGGSVEGIKLENKVPRHVSLSVTTHIFKYLVFFCWYCVRTFSSVVLLTVFVSKGLKTQTWKCIEWNNICEIRFTGANAWGISLCRERHVFVLGVKCLCQRHGWSVILPTWRCHSVNVTCKKFWAVLLNICI